MSKRSYIGFVRDGAFMAAAFAMVLYMTVAEHRRDRSDLQLASTAESIVVGSSALAQGQASERFASAERDMFAP